MQRAVALAETGPAAPQLVAQVRDLLAELDQQQRDTKLLADLDQAWPRESSNYTNQGSFLIEALEAYGLDIGQGTPEQTAALINTKPPAVREQLLAALQELLFMAQTPVGIALAQDSMSNRLFVNSVFHQGPAARDGRLRKLDRLVGIGQGREGEMVDTHQMTLPEILELLRGEPGTVVRVAFFRGGETQICEMSRDPTWAWLFAVVEAADEDPWRRSCGMPSNVSTNRKDKQNW